MPRFSGPHTVVRVINDTAFELNLDPKTQPFHPVFHTSLLKKLYKGDKYSPPPAPVSWLGVGTDS
jgi:hypothetical protein